MTAPTRILPAASDDAAWTVERVAELVGVDLPDLAAHDLAHPGPVLGCPWCPQAMACRECGLPGLECPDPAGHRSRYAASETALLAEAVGR